MYPVELVAGCDVEGFAVGAGPGEIGDFFGYEDRAEGLAFTGEDPDAAGTGAVEVSLLIDLHAVGAAGTFIRSCVVEEFSFGEGAVGLNAVAHPYLLRLGVADVEIFLVGRKGDAVGTGEVADEKLQLCTSGGCAGFLFERVRDTVDAVDLELLGGVGVFLRGQTVGRIGEVERAVGFVDEVVGAVELLALIGVGEDGDG